MFILPEVYMYLEKKVALLKQYFCKYLQFFYVKKNKSFEKADKIANERNPARKNQDYKKMLNFLPVLSNSGCFSVLIFLITQ